MTVVAEDAVPGLGWSRRAPGVLPQAFPLGTECVFPPGPSSPLTPLAAFRSVRSRWGTVDQSPPRPRPQADGSGPRDTLTSALDHTPQSSSVLVNNH